jgi:hypothetical protein
VPDFIVLHYLSFAGPVAFQLYVETASLSSSPHPNKPLLGLTLDSLGLSNSKGGNMAEIFGIIKDVFSYLTSKGETLDRGEQEMTTDFADLKRDSKIMAEQTNMNIIPARISAGCPSCNRSTELLIYSGNYQDCLTCFEKRMERFQVFWAEMIS